MSIIKTLNTLKQEFTRSKLLIYNEFSIKARDEFNQLMKTVLIENSDVKYVLWRQGIESWRDGEPQEFEVRDLLFVGNKSLEDYNAEMDRMQLAYPIGETDKWGYKNTYDYLEDKLDNIEQLVNGETDDGYYDCENYSQKPKETKNLKILKQIHSDLDLMKFIFSSGTQPTYWLEDGELKLEIREYEDGGE